MDAPQKKSEKKEWMPKATQIVEVKQYERGIGSIVLKQKVTHFPLLLLE